MLTRAALHATEMNARHSLLSLSKDGISIAAFDDMAPVKDEAGKVDRKATARQQLSAARDFFVEAVTPDKALLFGTVGAVGGEERSVPGGVAGSLLGLVCDAAEAVPAAAVSVAYLTGASIHGALALVRS